MSRTERSLIRLIASTQVPAPLPSLALAWIKRLCYFTGAAALVDPCDLLTKPTQLWRDCCKHDY